MKRITVKLLTLLKALLISTLALSQVTGVDAIGITVKEMDRSLPFYTDVLGFVKLSDREYHGEIAEQLQGLFGLNMRVVRLRLGDEFIELTDYLTTGGRSIPEDAKSNDLFFQHIAIVVSDMDKAYQHLRKFNVTHVSTAPQTLPRTIPAAEGIRAFYFQDPDGHNLELIFFPKGKGQEKWQQQNGKLFMGIDHTAIGVSSSEKSHHFYQELLGLDRKGESRNKGTEQEHLNNVEGASLLITGYRAATGPGIEFLQYLHPGPGKKYPADSRTDDIWHWQTLLVTPDAEALYRKLRPLPYIFISKSFVREEREGVVLLSFIVRDPDGHAIRIIERKP